MSTLVGSPSYLSASLLDGPALNATTNQPQGVAIASNGDIYWVDSGNCCIRKLSQANNAVSTFASGLCPSASAPPLNMFSNLTNKGLALSSSGKP